MEDSFVHKCLSVLLFLLPIIWLSVVHVHMHILKCICTPYRCMLQTCICVYVKPNLLFHTCSITTEISSKISSFFGGGSSEEDSTSTPPQGEATGEEQTTNESTTDQSSPESDKQGLNKPIAICYLLVHKRMSIFNLRRFAYNIRRFIKCFLQYNLAYFCPYWC